jgi:hypothetical protein
MYAGACTECSPFARREYRQSIDDIQAICKRRFQEDVINSWFGQQADIPNHHDTKKPSDLLGSDGAGWQLKTN